MKEARRNTLPNTKPAANAGTDGIPVHRNSRFAVERNCQEAIIRNTETKKFFGIVGRYESGRKMPELLECRFVTTSNLIDDEQSVKGFEMNDGACQFAVEKRFDTSDCRPTRAAPRFHNAGLCACRSLLLLVVRDT